MQLKEISKDIYDVSAMLDEMLGKEGTPERERNRLVGSKEECPSYASGIGETYWCGQRLYFED